MKSQQSKMLHLTARDHKIFDYLYDRRLATIYQIIGHLKISTLRENLSRRLNKLVLHKYLYSDWVDRKKVFFLGNKSLEMLRRNEALSKKYAIAVLGFDRNKARHDLLLNDVYYAIESTGAIEVLKTHNNLFLEIEDWSHTFNLPDGKFTINHPSLKRYWGLELELYLKSIDRYRKIFELYYIDQNLLGVLYLVKSKKEIKSLKEIDNKIRLEDESKVFVATIDDFLNDPLHTKFHSSTNKFFSFHWALTIDQRKEFSLLTTAKAMTQQ